MFLTKLLLLLLIVFALRRVFQSRPSPQQGAPRAASGNGQASEQRKTAPALDLVKCPACGDYVAAGGGAVCARSNCPSIPAR